MLMITFYSLRSRPWSRPGHDGEASDPEEWYRQRGRKYRSSVAGRTLREQCVEAVKRDVVRHLDHLADLPAELRELLLAAFLQGRILDARLLRLCIQNGLYSLDLSKATRFGQDSVDAVLKSCPHIHTLNLTACLYLDAESTLRLMRGLPELSTLILDQNEYDSRGFGKIIKHATQLRNLSIRDCTLAKERRASDEPAVDPFEHLPILSRLSCLWLSNLTESYVNSSFDTYCKPYTISASTLNQFLEASADNLQCLDISHLCVEGEVQFDKAHRLAALYLAGHSFNRDPGAFQASMVALGSGLHCLSLSDCHVISDNAFSEVIDKFPNLRELHLGNHKTLTTSTLKRIGRCCPHLQILHLRGCLSLEPSGFGDNGGESSLPFPALRELDIISCPLLTYNRGLIDVGAPDRIPQVWMASCLPALERLGVSWSPVERAEALRLAPSLERIVIYGLS